MRILIDKTKTVGRISEGIFSSFIEQMGRAVYGGIYEEGHPSATEEGFRGDVIDAVRELNIRYVRYPGGNMLSGYRWQDGVGEVSRRPVRMEAAWKEIEPNTFGLDEFMKWCKYVSAEPIMAINFGTGSLQDAWDLVEYCNYPGGTALSDYRIRNGAEKPYGIENWCLGNEMDGEWQIGAMTMEEYVGRALKTARYLKKFNPKLKFTACGSSNQTMPTFPEWNRVVLEAVYDDVEYISLHQYFEYRGDDDEFFASVSKMNEYIDVTRATIKYVKALKRSKHDVYISFDEYNVWNHSPRRNDWQVAPSILEIRYTMRDALVLGGAIITLLNNCDVVRIACLAQLVNILAPILTETGGGLVKETIYYAFSMFSTRARGETLLPFISGAETIDGKGGKYEKVVFNACYGDGKLNLFFVNFNKEENVEVELFDFCAESSEGFVITGGLDDVNDFERERIRIEKFNGYNAEKDRITVSLPGYSIVNICVFEGERE